VVTASANLQNGSMRHQEYNHMPVVGFHSLVWVTVWLTGF